MKSEDEEKKPVGRPRAFCTDLALDRALGVFWEKGYEGASLSDLTEAMGINRPSLYAAFGNKEALFRKVADRYAERFGHKFCEALAEPTARQTAESLLLGATAPTSSCSPRGCLLVQSALACGEEAQTIKQDLMTRRQVMEAKLRDRFEKAVATGELTSATEAAALAKFVMTVLHGISVQTASGASQADVRRVAELALRAWPSHQSEPHQLAPTQPEPQ
ncbi:MAG: TetR/AcrR family transcriptional regulator [Tepidisphaeraceae bacterium]